MEEKARKIQVLVLLLSQLSKVDKPYIYISSVYNSFGLTFRFFLGHPGITYLEEMTNDFRQSASQS